MTPPMVWYSSVPSPPAGPPPNRYPPPPPTPTESCPLPLPNAHLALTISYLYIYNFFDSISLPPPLNTRLDPKSRGAARGHRPHMPMTPVCTSISRVLSRWWNITTKKEKKDNRHTCYNIKINFYKYFFHFYTTYSIFRAASL